MESDDNYQKVTNKTNYNGYLTVIGGMSLHLVCGNVYLWGNIANYVISYFHFQGDQNASMKVAIVILPISWTMHALFNPVGAFLIKKVNI